MHPSRLLLLLLLASCAPEKKETERSFYYWKTTFSADSSTADLIQKEQIGHFYIRYFDVSWDSYSNMPVPVAEVMVSDKASSFIQKKYTPVVFITNDCFENMQPPWIDSLAVKVSNKIIFINNALRNVARNHGDTSEDNIDEIQIDCDWTSKTKESYFNFLRKIKKRFPGKKISATIRLYPYKYPALMGVPPVDKGMLMCYNITDIKRSETPNSIFTLGSLKQYLDAKPYPLPLDIALPVFGWYAWFRGNRFIDIIYAERGDSLFNNSFEKKGNSYLLLTDTFINNNYLQRDDVLRAEYPDPAELEAAAALLRQKLPKAGRISFYYWNKNLVKKYATPIHNIYSSF